MSYFSKKLLQDTVKNLVSRLSQGELQQVLTGSKVARVALADLQQVIAEHGHRITMPPTKIKLYCTPSDTPSEAVYVDIRLFVDYKPSDVVLRCTFYSHLLNGLYEYTVDDMLAP